MALMVYIQEIHPGSFLHCSTSGESFCLRDFSESGRGPAIELARQSAGRTASTIRELASKPGNHQIEVSGQGRGIEDYAFWHEETRKLNARYVKSQTPTATLPGPSNSWLVENVLNVVVAVVTAVVIAVVLAWLGLKQ
jgi:hypothetical protein